MNLDHNKMAGTGRTTRMLQYAFERAQNDLPSLILGDTTSHIGSLRKVMDDMIGSVGDLPERMRLGDRISYGTLGMMTRNNNRGVSRFYDYGTHNFKFEVDPKTEVLIDHFALERQLVYVTLYLRASAHLEDAEDWIIDTARMMSVMGKRAFVVSDNVHFLDMAKDALHDYNASVEDGEHLSNLNLLKLELVGANPNCVLLVDPSMLKKAFEGALNEINRWDAKPKPKSGLMRRLIGLRDPYLTEAVAFAKTHGPCLVVVDTIEVMNQVSEILLTHGMVYRISASLDSVERRLIFEKFETDQSNSYLLMTRQMAALGGWRLKRQVSLAATGLLSQNWATQIGGRVPAPTARFINVRGQNDVKKDADSVQPQAPDPAPTALNQSPREKHSNWTDDWEK